MLSPLQVKDHKLVEFSLRPIKENYSREAESHVVSCRHGLLCEVDADDSEHWTLRLRIIIENSEEHPSSQYTGEFEMMGEFQIHPDFPEEKREKLVRMSGGSILYGALREWVATVSARSINGLLELPTVDTRSFVSTEKPSVAASRKKAARTTISQKRKP